MSQMNSHPLPPWTTRVLPHVEGAGLVIRELAVDGLWLAALLLLAWFVIGVIAGFLSLTALVGAGGVAGTAETLRKVLSKHDSDNDKGSSNE